VKRILIVDDDPDILASLELLLTDSYDVRVAEDGPSALSVLSRERIDAVILDLMMPLMDGMAVMLAIAAQGIEVAVIVASARPDAAAIAASLGAADVVMKPYDAQTLELCLSRVLGTSGDGGSGAPPGGSGILGGGNMPPPGHRHAPHAEV
jgi:DNA-binding response OmpR family regulator